MDDSIEFFFSMAEMYEESDNGYTTDCDTESDSGSESPAKQPLQKKTKYTGAFKYKTQFNKDWIRDYPFISPVHYNPNGFRCMKNLSCAHQGVSDVKAHVATCSHQSKAKQMATQSRINFTSDPLADKVCLRYIHVLYISTTCSRY